MGKTIEERFFAKVCKTDNCWIWTGGVAGRRNCKHGTIRRSKTEKVYAHRLSWEIHFGDIPGGLEVLHKCDNPVCVRPDHLFLGTQGDNNQDRERKGRSAIFHGENNPRRKLSLEDVGEIRKSSSSNVSLAKQYGVTDVMISRIRSGKAWCQEHEKFQRKI